MVAYFTLLLALVATFVGKGVGTSGGEIRHTEIRATATSQAADQAAESAEDGE